MYRLSSHIGALSVLICYPDIHELDGIKVLQSRTGHYQLISKPSIREGVSFTSLLFQKIGLDNRRERKGCDECATR